MPQITFFPFPTKCTFVLKLKKLKSLFNKIDFLKKNYLLYMVQSVRAFASNAKGWVFESQPRQTLVVKTGSDDSTAKSSARDPFFQIGLYDRV